MKIFLVETKIKGAHTYDSFFIDSVDIQSAIYKARENVDFSSLDIEEFFVRELGTKKG